MLWWGCGQRILLAACCGGGAGEGDCLLLAVVGVQAKEAALLRAVLGMQEKVTSLLQAVVGAGEGGCAAAHCRGCKRRRLRCFLLRGQAEQAALSYVVVSAKRKRLRCVACFGGQAKEAALLHAAEDAGVRGCAPAWRGGCRQRGLRKWMLRCA